MTTPTEGFIVIERPHGDDSTEHVRISFVTDQEGVSRLVGKGLKANEHDRSEKKADVLVIPGSRFTTE